MIERIDSVVVGGEQAGLAMSRGESHVFGRDFRPVRWEREIRSPASPAVARVR